MRAISSEKFLKLWFKMVILKVVIIRRRRNLGSYNCFIEQSKPLKLDFKKEFDDDDDDFNNRELLEQQGEPEDDSDKPDEQSDSELSEDGRTQKQRMLQDEGQPSEFK